MKYFNQYHDNKNIENSVLTPLQMEKRFFDLKNEFENHKKTLNDNNNRHTDVLREKNELARNLEDLKKDNEIKSTEIADIKNQLDETRNELQMELERHDLEMRQTRDNKVSFKKTHNKNN